jgi:hypothetical protein
VTGALAAATVLLGMAVSAPGAVAVTPPRGIPDLRQMALRVSDLPPGAKVKRHGYVETSSVAEYEREFASLTAVVGGKRLLGLENDLFLERSASIAAGEFVELRHLLGTKRGRQALAKQLEQALGFDPDFVRVGMPFGFGAGQESLGVALTIGTFLGTFQAELGFFRVDRVVAELVFEGRAGTRLARSDLTRLARPVAARMAVGQLPAPSVLPSVSGTPTVGQKLTALRGTWRNGPLSFAYRWQRCDPAGANCVDIAGATAPTYVLLDDDAGATVRVEVTATNGVGATTRFSAPTAVVAAYVGAPVNVVAPSITGTAAQGQTLTAAPGTWVGRPTAFAYQWQRCDATGANCVAVDGATAATYVVGPADLGATLRVVVTATNASGAATAVSPPTATVT